MKSRASASVRQWICADALDVANHLGDPVDPVLMANTFHDVPDQTRLAVEPAGFCIARIMELPPYDYEFYARELCPQRPSCLDVRV